MKRLLMMAVILCWAGCQTIEIPGKVYFAVMLDESWSSADSITVSWVRHAGDTTLLHERKLPPGKDSLHILADGYEGGAIALILRGFSQGGLTLYQIRLFDGSSGKVTFLENKDLAPPLIRIKAVAPRTFGDSVDLSAIAEGRGKSLQAYAWDYQGDGRFDEAGPLRDTIASISGGFRYALAAEYVVKLRIIDAWNVASYDTVRVSIRQDFPKADAGPNLEARRLSQVTLRGQAEDTLGRIVKREWKIGAQGFQEVDTSGRLAFSAPDSAGQITCLFRATDDDGQTAVDTLFLTLLAVSDPTLSALLPSDTTVTIGDTLTWTTTATPGTAGLATMAWDMGTGVFGAPIPVSAGKTGFKQGMRFAGPKEITVRARLVDSAGRLANAASARVKVVIDSPKVFAGADTILPVGGLIRLHGKASDGLGSIVRTEWSLGGIFRQASPDTQFAAATPGTFDYVFRAIDDDGLISIDSMQVRVTPSTSAGLSELSLVGVAFDTAFRANRYLYSASVANSVASVQVKAALTANSQATIKVKGVPLVSGSTTKAIDLGIGANLIDIAVTAQDTSIHQNYLISVTRAANDNAFLLNLHTSLGQVSPAFRDTLFSYTVYAPYHFRTVTVFVEPVASATKVTYNGKEFPLNFASDSIELIGAKTQIRIGTLAQSGKILTYNLTVNRDTASDQVVSDFESRSAQNSVGGSWGYLSDSPDSGNSKIFSGDTSSLTTLINANSFSAGNAGSDGALLMDFRYGNLKPKCGTGCTYGNWVGIYSSLKPNNDSVVNLTGATAITFYAKADTNLSGRFSVQTKNVLDFGYFRSMITLTTAWKKYTVYLREGSNPEELARPLWASTATPNIPFKIDLVTFIDLQLSTEENSTVTHGKVWIDDVTIVGWRKR